MKFPGVHDTPQFSHELGRRVGSTCIHWETPPMIISPGWPSLECRVNVDMSANKRSQCTHRYANGCGIGTVGLLLRTLNIANFPSWW